jgi:hypothetical protein
MHFSISPILQVDFSTYLSTKSSFVPLNGKIECFWPERWETNLQTCKAHTLFAFEMTRWLKAAWKKRVQLLPLLIG